MVNDQLWYHGNGTIAFSILALTHAHGSDGGGENTAWWCMDRTSRKAEENRNAHTCMDTWSMVSAMKSMACAIQPDIVLASTQRTLVI